MEKYTLRAPNAKAVLSESSSQRERTVQELHSVVKDKKTLWPDVPTDSFETCRELRTEDNDKLHRILIVEDNDELRNYLFQSFQDLQCTSMQQRQGSADHCKTILAGLILPTS